MPARPGEKIGRYTVETVLGAGAMATVYAVAHDTLKTRHALKVLEGGNENIRQRLIQEGQVQASLKHANAVAVTDVFEYEGAPVLLMEMVEGPDLEQLLEEHTFELDDALAVFGGILAGLRSAHERDIIHRDLKPGNVLLGIDPREVTPKVADFGLAKALDDSAEGRKTKAGATMGTPAYMAPEQIKDSSTADNRADIFSLGCILYELVTGQQCFRGDNIFSIFSSIATLDFVPVKELNPDVPDIVIEAIDGALMLDRDQRYQSCDAMAEVLFGSSTGFATTVTVAGPSGQAASALWERQQAAAKKRAITESMADAATQPTFDEPVPDTVALPTVAAPAAPAAGPGGAFYGAIALVTVLLMVIILGGAGAFVLIMTGDDDTGESAEDSTERVAKPDPDADPTQPAAAPSEPTPTEAAEQPASPEPEAPAKKAPVAKKKAVTPPKVDKPDPEPTTVKPKVDVAPIAVAVPVKPAATGGSLKVVGDALSVTLVSSTGKRYSEGDDIPAGSYTIAVDFGGGENAGGGIAAIAAGNTTVVNCMGQFGKCTIRR